MNPSLISHRRIVIAFSVSALVTAMLGISLIAPHPQASAQFHPRDLEIVDFTATESEMTSSGLRFEAQVGIRNTGETDFTGIQRVDLQIGDSGGRLVYIVTNLAAQSTLRFTFSFELGTGTHAVQVSVGDSHASLNLTVLGADISIEVDEYRILRGRTVDFDLAISNSGGLVAEDLTLAAMWQQLDADTEDAVAGSRNYQGVIPNLGPGRSESVEMQVRIPPGAYRIAFNVATSSLETELSNNVVEKTADIEFVDLRTRLVDTQPLGWNPDGDVLMSFVVEFDNAGVDDIKSFYVGAECADAGAEPCSNSSQVAILRAGHETTTELRLWLPPGELTVRIFAVENEDTFRWGNFNVIEPSITAPATPDQIWTLAQISEPKALTYWSDGSANVGFELTMLNNGTEKPVPMTVSCIRDEIKIEGCGAEFTVDMDTDVYPTTVRESMRLPKGRTTLQFDYGVEDTETATAIVPERIIGVRREVWDCFSDTSNLIADEEAEYEDYDEGIGCAGWEHETVNKWQIGKPIKLWTFGDAHYLSILDETIAELGPFLNLTFERVDTKSDAQIKIFTGIDRKDAVTAGLDCVEFGGCARTRVESNGRISSSRIAIWKNRIADPVRRDHSIRATTLHELLHALTNVKHRHHDRTSVMSYESLDYVSIEGMDHGLFELLAHPLVKPGMSFDDVRKHIVFADELNDPPVDSDLSARSLLRMAHAAMMDAGSFSYQVKGNWPGCSGNHDFGWADFQSAKLRPYGAVWQHFDDSSDLYYYIGDPTNWTRSEWWLRRGRQWFQADPSAVSDATTFRAGFSSPFRILDDINVYAKPSAFEVIARRNTNVELAIRLNEPNPEWSRNLDLEIYFLLDPETYQIIRYHMRWNFDPRYENNCDTYHVEGRNPQYGIDIKFPDNILQTSLLLNPTDETDTATVETAIDD